MKQAPLHLIVIEPTFPGRLGPVVDWLVRRRGYRAHVFCHRYEPEAFWPPSVGRGLDLIQYGIGGVAREPAAAWTRLLERGLCYAYGAWEVVDARRIRPADVILGRSAGLGSTLFAPVSHPRCPLVNFFDGYLHPCGEGRADEPESDSPQNRRWRRAANAMDLLDLENASLPWSPTAWQHNLYPPEYRSDFLVLFDGVESDLAEAPATRGASRRVAGRAIPPDARLVSFIARTPDRARGIDRFLDLAERLLAERTDVICAVAGGGPGRRIQGVGGREIDALAGMLAGRPLAEHPRFWRLGVVTPGTVAELLLASDLVVAPSRVQAVARPMVEAMAAGAVVLAWDGAPAQEFIERGRTGLLIPADDPEAAVAEALRVLDDPADARPLGEAARLACRERWTRDATLPVLAARLGELAGSESAAGVYG